MAWVPPVDAWQPLALVEHVVFHESY